MLQLILRVATTKKWHLMASNENHWFLLKFSQLYVQTLKTHAMGISTKWLSRRHSRINIENSSGIPISLSPSLSLSRLVPARSIYIAFGYVSKFSSSLRALPHSDHRDLTFH